MIVFWNDVFLKGCQLKVVAGRHPHRIRAKMPKSREEDRSEHFMPARYMYTSDFYEATRNASRVNLNDVII